MTECEFCRMEKKLTIHISDLGTDICPECLRKAVRLYGATLDSRESNHIPTQEDIQRAYEDGDHP